MENKKSLKELNRDELIEYIDSLEEDIFEKNFEIDKNRINLEKYKLLVKDILHSSNEILNTDRFSEEIDYEESVKNLNKYIKKYLEDNNLYL